MAHTSHTGHGHGADPHTDHGLESVAVHHEVTDIPLAGTTRAALISLGAIAAVFVLMWGAWGFFLRQAAAIDPGKPAGAPADFGQRLPATPRLQSKPGGDLAGYRAEQSAKINGLAWVDQAAGTVRIPIASAMHLIVARADAFADQQAKAPEAHSWAFPGAARTDLAGAAPAPPLPEHSPSPVPAPGTGQLPQPHTAAPSEQAKPQPAAPPH
jgi:hypothetical protein